MVTDASSVHDVRVVHLTTVHPRCDIRVFHREGGSLARLKGAEVHLIVADGGGSNPAFVNDVSVPVHDLGVLPGGRVGRLLIGSWRALATVRRIGPKVVHFHDPELIPVGLLLKLFGYRVIYDVHEDVPRQVLSKRWIPKIVRRPASLFVAAIEWIAAKSFDAIVAATPLIAKRFPGTRTTIVQNFPVLAEFRTREAPGYAERPSTFVYVGGLSIVRGVQNSILAVGLLEGHWNARLSLAGQFRPAGLESELKMLPGWGQVEFHGWATRERVAELLAGARAGLVVLHPIENYLDAYPVKLFEYMAAGLPVIASDFPLWRSIIDQARCGLLVDPLEPEKIAGAMRWILENPKEAAEMGRRGQSAAAEKYHWEPESKKLLDVYRKLLATA